MDEYGIYFTNDEQFADDFSYERTPTDSQFFDKKGEKGEVYEAYLNIENPLDSSELAREDIENLYGYANDFALQVYENRDAFVEDMLHLQQIGNHQLMKGNLDMESIAKDSDYNGVIANLDPRDQSKKEYGVFDSNQIKSVNNTNPTSNNDIRYSLGLDSKLKSDTIDVDFTESYNDSDGKLERESDRDLRTIQGIDPVYADRRDNVGDRGALPGQAEYDRLYDQTIERLFGESMENVEDHENLQDHVADSK